MLRVGGQEVFRLLYQGEHRYVASVDPETSITFSAESDVARQLVIRQEGSELSALRVE
jgi:hypothetical protein